MNIFGVAERIKNKFLSYYRRKVFEAFVEKKCEGLKIKGKVIIDNTNLLVGKDVTIYPNVTFWGDGKIVIGNGVSIGQGTIIYSSKENGCLEIGDGTHISAYCYIIDMDHGTKINELIANQKNTYAKVSIGNDVWIAAGCKILKGSLISDGAIIGAGAVVKGFIPQNSIAVGVPCRVINHRQEE